MSDFPKFDLAGRVALVTGAARGLGGAISLALAHAGGDVALGLRDVHSGGELVHEIEALERRALPLQMDMTHTEQIFGAVEDAVGHFGRLDILVNNAGTIRRAPAADHSDEDWDAVVETNLTSAFRLCRGVGRHMLERGRGKIVNIASLLAFQGGITAPGYAAAKGGPAQVPKPWRTSGPAAGST